MLFNANGEGLTPSPFVFPLFSTRRANGRKMGRVQPLPDKRGCNHPQKRARMFGFKGGCPLAPLPPSKTRVCSVSRVVAKGNHNHLRKRARMLVFGGGCSLPPPPPTFVHHLSFNPPPTHHASLAQTRNGGCQTLLSSLFDSNSTRRGKPYPFLFSMATAQEMAIPPFPSLLDSKCSRRGQCPLPSPFDGDSGSLLPF